MTTPAAKLAPVDVGITLGELDGHTVVIGALATAGITTQFQLPPAAAASLGAGILAAAAAAGADITSLLDQLHAVDGMGLVVPDLADVVRHGGS